MSGVDELALGPDWSKPSLFRDTTHIAGVRVELAGYSATHRSGQLVTGSAASLEGNPQRRALWELVERTGLFEASQRAQLVPILSQRHDPLGFVEHEAVFPVHTHYRHSLSNGTAAGETFADACLRARLELIERDRVLRSWHGHGKPQALDMQVELPPTWSELYAFHSVRLPATDTDLSSAEVCALVALPRLAGVPLACGFGAGLTVERAVASAKRELVQVIGFLWGEELPRRAPAIEASPDFHQAWYLYPGHHEQIAAWLSGAHERAPDSLHECAGHSYPGYADLTPAHLHGRLWVVKALPTNELSLTFGVAHPHLAAAQSELRRIHPIA